MKEVRNDEVKKHKQGCGAAQCIHTNELFDGRTVLCNSFMNDHRNYRLGHYFLPGTCTLNCDVKKHE